MKTKSAWSYTSQDLKLWSTEYKAEVITIRLQPSTEMGKGSGEDHGIQRERD
jgi:hypothetical protein